MKVSTRIISGFGIVMILALLALAYQVYFINRMQSINAELSSIDFQAASILLHLQHDTEAIEEFSRKYFTASPDPEFARVLDDIVKEFDDEVSTLQNVVGSQSTAAPDIERLITSWSDYKSALEAERSMAAARPPDDLPSELAPDFEEKVDQLRLRTGMAYEAVDRSINTEVSRAAAIGAQAQQLSWLAAGATFLLGLSLTVVIVRAISDPLRQLTQGTRLIAKGQFWHRLPAYNQDEFAELARDFNTMCERLGELDKMKKEFVSHVSHELKAPLASIRQTCHLLLEQIPGPLNDQQLKLLRLSNNSAERLAAMVGNLLDVSRMDAGTMEYDMARNDLVAITRLVADEFEVQAQDKNVGLIVENEQPKVIVECDRDRIIQVIGNLFDNALKFSPRNSEIRARIKIKDSSVLVSVADLGPGVPSDHKDRVFMKFHQVKQGKKIAGQGVGLGLAICKSIVEAHEGKIWAEDNPGGGSIFFLELRASAKAEAVHAGKISTSA